MGQPAAATGLPRYIKINGVMQKNPQHPDNQKQAGHSTIAAPNKALVPVCTINDIADQNASGGAQIQMAQAAEVAIDMMQDQSTLQHYSQGVGSGELVDGLGEIFQRYEVPVGLMSKILELSTEQMHLEFLIDDSGSMGTIDAVLTTGQKCSRWAEAQERLMILMEILAYVPVASIRIQFLNRPTVIQLTHHGFTPQTFKQNAAVQLQQAFQAKPSGLTPVAKNLNDIFARAMTRPAKTCVYLFFDGAPSEGKQATEQLLLRRNAAKIPFTFVTCTGRDEDVEWAKEIEEKPMPDGSPSFMAELDDFVTERKEVLHDQGEGIPYSFGFYLVCHLVAAINPTDLDALDESVPFTKRTMDNLMGRTLSGEEYGQYFGLFMNNPYKNAQEKAEDHRLWHNLYQQFARGDIEACQIPQVKQYLASKHHSYVILCS
jgi:hypothetical protein